MKRSNGEGTLYRRKVVRSSLRKPTQTQEKALQVWSLKSVTRTEMKHLHKLNDAIDSDLRVPSDMIPRCPKCGAEMEPWVRSWVFLEGKKYREEHSKLNAFLKKNMNKNPNLYVFSAHLHMDEATRHLHIDFVPFTTGGKRGLDTRVSLKRRG